jgi:hypothetical protein
LQIEAVILRYVVQHPAAKDTVEGIAEWWLLEPQMHASVTEVKEALEKLVAQGQLAAEQQADGRIYYHRAKAEQNHLVTKRDRIKKLNPGRASGQKTNQPKKS